MLQTMRGLAQSWAFKALMGFLIISFGIWGIGDIFRGNPQQRAVAHSGKITVTVQDLDREFKASLPEARRALGPDLTEQQAKQMGVMDRTLNLLVEHAKFDQEAKRLGIVVEDKQILAELAARPDFRTKDGRFNNELWQKVLQKGGFSERVFLDEQSKETARRLIFDSMIGNVQPPQSVIDNLYQALGGKRIVEVLAIHDDSIAAAATPDEESLRNYYHTHEADFMAPEYRALTILEMSSDAVNKAITLGDDELQKAYEARTEELTRPEQRDLVQAVLQDEGKAKNLAKQTAIDGSLATAAKKLGVDVVTLDRVDEKTILPELYTSAFALEENQATGPVKSSLGWHVVEVKKIHAPGKLTFDEAKADLAESIKKEKSADAVSRQLNVLEDELAAGHALEDVADSLKLRLIKIPALNQNGLTPTGKAPDEIPAAEEVKRYAYQQGVGEVSPVVDDKHGNYLVIRTDEIAAAHIESFDQVKDKVVAAWKREQQATQAAAEAEEIAKKMRDGKPAASFATRKGIDIRVSKPISLLGDTDKNLPPRFVPMVLKMKQGDVITAEADGKHYVLRLTEIVPVDTAKPDASRARVVDELKDRLPLDILDQYAKALNRRFPITINQSLLDSLKQQGG